MKKIPVLVINSWNSKCLNCGKDCDPSEKKHKTVLGYKPEGVGCGIKWTKVGSEYAGKAVEEWCKRTRPDLEFVDIFTFTPSTKQSESEA